MWNLTGAVLLKKWREAHGYTLTEAAKILKTFDPVQYNKYELGLKRPSLDTAVKIEAGTKGAVPVKAWTTRAA